MNKLSFTIPFSTFCILLSCLFCKNCTFPSSENPSLQIAIPSEPATLNPRFATDLTSSKILRLIHSTLFQQDRFGKPIPYLAKGYKFNPSNHTLEIYLPDYLNSNIVYESLKNLVELPGPRKAHYKSILSINILAPNKILLNLDKNAKLEDILILLSLPPSSIQGNTGAYILKHWKKNEYIKLEKNFQFNPQWSFYHSLPDEITIRIVPNSTTGLFLFQKGKLDSLKLSDFLLGRDIIKDKSIIEKKGRSVQYVAINNQNPCFDKNFRKALNLSIDREKIIQSILENKAELTIGPFPLSRLSQEELNYKLPLNEYKTEEYNLELAKSYLKKSKCFPEILDITLDFRMRADDENRSKGRAVAEYIRKLGLKVKIRPMEKTLLYKENGLGLGDLTFLTWYVDESSLLAFLDPLFHPYKLGNGGNRAFYKNEEILKWIQEKKYSQALKLVLEDKPWIFLWSVYENYLVSQKIYKYPKIIEFL